MLEPNLRGIWINIQQLIHIHYTLGIQHIHKFLGKAFCVKHGVFKNSFKTVHMETCGSDPPRDLLFLCVEVQR